MRKRYEIMGVTYQRWWCALCWLFSLDKSKDRFIKCWFTCIGRQESKTMCWKDLYVGLPAWDLDKLGKGWQEPHAVQQKEVQSSPPVEEQHHALLHAGSHWAGKQKRPWGSWWTPSWMWASNVPLQKRRSSTSWASLSRTLPADPSPLFSPWEACLEHCVLFWNP